MVNSPLRRSYFVGGCWHWGYPFVPIMFGSRQNRSVTYLGKDFAYVPVSSLFGCFLFTDYLGVKKTCFLSLYLFFWWCLRGTFIAPPCFFGVKRKKCCDWKKKLGRREDWCECISLVRYFSPISGAGLNKRSFGKIQWLDVLKSDFQGVTHCFSENLAFHKYISWSHGLSFGEAFQIAYIYIYIYR